MKRSLTIVLLSILAVGMLFAGGSSESSSSAAATSGTITYWNIASTSPDKDIVENAVAQYNANPVNGYGVDSVPTQNDKYKEKLIIAMSSGQAPDMYSSWSGGPLFEYVDSGFAQPLEGLLENSPIKEKISQAGLEQSTYNGHIYGIPYLNISIAGIFYNKDIFAKYGLTEPQTFDELVNICEVLKANGITPFALANRTKWTGSMYFICLATRLGGLEPFQNAVAGTGSFEDDCFIQAGEILQDWVRKGYFPEGVNSLDEDDGQARQLIYQETAGMLLCGSWYTGTFAADSREFYESKIGWFPFPAVEGSDADPTIQIGTVGDQFITINASVTGEKLEAAWAAIEAHLSDETIATGIANGKIPPIEGVEAMIEDPVAKEIAYAASTAPAIQLWYDQYLPPTVATAHLDGMQEVFGLTKTPAQAQAEMQAAMDAYNASK